MKKYIIIIAGLLLLALTACDEVEVNPGVKEDKEKEEEGKINTVIHKDKITISDKEIEFDKLQKLYIDINNGLTYDELINRLDESDLFYDRASKRIYQETDEKEDELMIAFSKSAANLGRRIRGEYKKDALQVQYSKDKGLNYAEYTKNEDHLGIYITLLNYKRGYHSDFSHRTEHAGYYIKDRNNKGDYKIDKDSSRSTDYIKADSIEDQLTYFFVSTNQELNKIFHNN